MNRRPRKLRAALLAFLSAHRGQAFCGTCVEVLLETTAADIALREAEGLGVQRRQGPCARCGQRRLVAGLRGEAGA